MSSKNLGASIRDRLLNKARVEKLVAMLARGEKIHG